MLKEVIHGLVGMLITEQPTLNDIKKWYVDEVLPLRSPGDLNRAKRMGKGFSAFIYGNSSDPKGLCGDVTTFIFETFEKKYPSFLAGHAGFELGAILKVGSVVNNHIANIIYPYSLSKYIPMSMYVTDKRLIAPDTKEFREGILSARDMEKDIWVLDLFYLEQPQTLAEWLEKRDYPVSELRMGREADFA